MSTSESTRWTGTELFATSVVSNKDDTESAKVRVLTITSYNTR